MVYVISKDNHPLMPCSNAIARLLLKQGKAKVKKRMPFTVKLTYETTGYTQPLILGVDTGSGTLGAAVSTETGDIVYLSEVTLRDDIPDRMGQRARYRRTRRQRKTRYRKARFLNRRNSTKEGRFSPTMRSKLHGHVKEVGMICSILPITVIVFETGTFDPHLMKNPSLANPEVRPWGYQQGANYGFENTKAMVLNRDGYSCQHCHGRRGDRKLEVHHIRYRSQGGSDDSGNLITLCHSCHKDLHAGKIAIPLSGNGKGTLKYATQMNSIRRQLLLMYPEAKETFGYVTKANSQLLGIKKRHCLDACVIASQGKPFSVKSYLYRKKCIPEGDFQQTKGIRSEKPVTTGKIGGFRKFDKVRYLGREFFIKGRMSSGYAVLMDFEGRKADFSGMPKGQKTPKLSRMIRLEARSSWIVIAEAAIQNTV